MAERTLRLSINETGAGAAAVFTFHVFLDDTPVASNQSLSSAQSHTVRELAWQYGQLFEQRSLPQLAREQLQTLGAQLFDLWLAHSWDKLSGKLRPGDQRVLLVASERPEVLNLPWELLRPAGGECIGADGKWSVRRFPWTDRQPAPAGTDLPAGPLRILHMVCAPQDQPELDFEREEELLTRAISQAGPRVVFDSGDLGSFDELGQRTDEFRPHIVHLTGHARVGEDGAYFLFENESGMGEEHSARELGQLLPVAECSVPS
jgi:hypothetical protein